MTKILHLQYLRGKEKFVFVQSMIIITGVTAVWLSQDARESRRRFACLFALCGQPFWLYSSYQSEQWGIFALSFVYTVAWCKGVRHFWWNRELKNADNNQD